MNETSDNQFGDLYFLLQNKEGFLYRDYFLERDHDPSEQVQLGYYGSSLEAILGNYPLMITIDLFDH